ncbi:hypothetical protein PV726_32530 [Streptomyces europaeiscabiei]|uniref:hypothetical protein n=1 Tax=Streptomyces europaeiscabiei TaxID=146819 RepID=UPI0029A72FA8|nr:hypothetical protein [Streptomyces europaeiscabiei]MDX3694985.1 hypothetical protein [Streptomyces europaeiscabiei]
MTTTTRPLAHRYHYGATGAGGRTAVHVDGATDPAGHVWKMSVGSRRWRAQGTGDSGSTNHTRKYEAAERLVAMVDVRAIVAAETERNRSLIGKAPDGWRLVSWEEIEREGYREVRPPANAPETYTGSGEHYPAGYAHTVMLRTVTRLHNGHVVITGTQYGEPGPFVMGMSPAHVALGALVAERTARLVAGETTCPGCAAIGPLYQAGTHMGCVACTAAETGQEPSSLPAPTSGDGAAVWRPGDLVSTDVTGTDGITDTRTGRVTETRTYIVERRREVSVQFPYFSGQRTCVPSQLFAAEREYVRSAETAGGWAEGVAACHTVYGPTGAPFTRTGVVIGFSDGPSGERMARVEFAGISGATPYPPGSLTHPGDPVFSRSMSPA